MSQVLEAFHHPYYATGKSKVQNDMIVCLRDWVDEHGVDKLVLIDALTKVRYTFRCIITVTHHKTPCITAKRP